MEYFKDQLDFSDLCLCSQVLSPTTGLQAQLPVLLCEYSFSSQKDIENYLSILSLIKDYYGQICEFQKLKAENNSFISKFACDKIIAQCKEFIGNKNTCENLLHTSFLNRLSGVTFLTDQEKNNYITKECVNTAIAGKEVAEQKNPTLAAIASSDTADLYGLKIIESNINSSRNNTTRFAAFSRCANHPEPTSKMGEHFILVFTVLNEAGSLAKTLNIIGAHGFNMRNLKSRPMKTLMWNYYFFIE